CVVRRPSSPAISIRLLHDALPIFTNLTDATPILRYAEVVLSMAEANARLGNLPMALTQLNQVRNRALAAPATEAYTAASFANARSEEHTSELQSRENLVCRLLLEQ